MRSARGGFELMDRPRDEYYTGLMERLGADRLTQVYLYVEGPHAKSSEEQAVVVVLVVVYGFIW